MPLRLLLALLLLAPLAGPAAAGQESSSLRDIIARARWIVIANVGETGTFADGHVFVHPLAVVRTLKGAEGSTLQAVELKQSSFREYETGQRVLTFLERAPQHSLYREHLPPGEYQATVAGRRGTGAIAPAGDAVAAEVVAAYRTLGPRKRPGRALLLRQLAAGHELLAADAVAQLDGRPKLVAKVTEQEQESFRACLEAAHVTPATKRRLTQLMAAHEMPGALALLRAWNPDLPALQAARGEALARLGEPPTVEEVQALLDHPDPDMRTFAVDEIARSQGDDGIPALASTIRTDENSRVRVAATGALGRVDTADAAVALETAFASDDPSVRVAAAAALKDMSDPETDVALRRLVRDSDGYDLQMRALLLLFARGASPEDPEIKRLVEEHPNPRLREVVEEGIHGGHHH